MPDTAIEYFQSERNKQTEPYTNFYDEALEALELYGAFKDMEEVLVDIAEIYKNREIVDSKERKE